MIPPKAKYILVPDWASTEYKLRGNELLVFSLIHGFSNNEESEFYGGVNYIAERLNCSDTTTIDILKKLVDKGMIVKRAVSRNGQYNTYRSNVYQNLTCITENNQVKDLEEQVKELEEKIKDLEDSGQVPCHNSKLNNKVNNKTNKIVAIPTEPAKLFRSSTSPNTDKKQSKVQQTFITEKYAVTAEYKFTPAVAEEVGLFIEMLAELKHFIPDMSFRMQLQELDKLASNKQLEVVKATITNCWKSLSYAIDNLNRVKKSSFDTAAHCTNQFKDPKNDQRYKIYEGRPTF